MPVVTTGDGGQIAYPKLGSGPVPVLLVHDWLFSGFLWQDVMEALPKDRYTVMMPDLRGTGLSFQPPLSYELDRYAEDLVALISQEQGFEKKWIVVGHGMGALIAQRLAQMYGRKVAALVLVAPITLAGWRPPGELREMLEEVSQDKAAASELIEKLFAEPPDDDTREMLLDDAEATAQVCLSGSLAMCFAGGPAEKLRKLRMPVLAITCGRDPFVGRAEVKAELVGKLPSATLVEIEASGHMAPLEAAEDLAARIDAFAREAQGG